MRLEDQVQELFASQPLLLGFSLDADLALADVEVETWPAVYWRDDVYAEVDDAIAVLVEDAAVRGEAELLRNHTFARRWH
jgi:hypothetical protein